MVYSTTISTKGQITIPKEVRDILGWEKGEKVFIELGESKDEVKLKVYPDILEIAGKLKPKVKKNVLKAREEMEKKYERV